MRLFIGTFLSPSNQDFYGNFVDQLVSRYAYLRGTPNGTAHLTYAFIGHGDDEALERVLDAVAEIARGNGKVPIDLSVAHVLPGGRVPRLVCAEVVKGRSELKRLANDIFTGITHACPHLEISPMRTPHVTLARFRRSAARPEGRQVSELLSATPPAEVTREDLIARVQVVTSELTRTGPVYEIRGEASLRAVPGATD